MTTAAASNVSKVFCLALKSLFFTPLMPTQDNWSSGECRLSLPGLTWRQIVTGLADDCSSLIGAAGFLANPRAAGSVPSALRSAANNPLYQASTWGQPISRHLPAIVVLTPGLLLIETAFEGISQHHSKRAFTGSVAVKKLVCSSISLAIYFLPIHNDPSIDRSITLTTHKINPL